MNTPQINPLPLTGFDLQDPRAVKIFQQYLANTLQQIANALTPNGLANILNGNSGLDLTSLLVSSNDLGTITTDQSVNAKNAPLVTIAFQSATTQARTLTINNLALGAVVFITILVSAGTLTFKCAANTPANAPYSVLALNTSTLVGTNLSTGLAIAAVVNAQFFAMSQLRGGVPFIFFYYV